MFIHASQHRHLVSRLGCLLLLCWAGATPAGESGGIHIAKAWRYRVYAQHLPAADDIVVGRDGSVYITQALGNGDGRIVRLRHGHIEVVARDLDYPRGLLLKKRHILYVTEQVNEGRVIAINLDNGERRVIGTLHSPEHMARTPDGDVVVTENGINGRLVRLRPNGVVDVITSGLTNPEGLCVGIDGTIYIGESGTGRVLSYKDGVLDAVIDDLDEPSQIESAADGALWITEKGNPGRLLRLKDGTLETVLNGLSDPRGIALLDNGVALVAESGRERILLVEPKP